jgi:hypothetical protein
MAASLLQGFKEGRESAMRFTMATEETFTEAEAEEIVTIAEEVSDQFEKMVDEEDVDAAVMYDAALLAAALFVTGTDEDDDSLIESFKESLSQARMMRDDKDEEDDEDEEEES